MGSPAAPYRLQFVPQAKAEQLRDEAVVLLVIAVGKRDKSGVYDAAQLRLQSNPKR